MVQYFLTREPNNLPSYSTIVTERLRENLRKPSNSLIDRCINTDIRKVLA